MSSFTITFGDQAQNHVGMQMIGKMAEHGYSRQDLTSAMTLFEKEGYKCELFNLNQYIGKEEGQDACVLVVRKGVDCLLGHTGQSGRELFEEMAKLDWDKKALMYGRVVNKHARHNLCFDDQEQQPNYEAGKGRVVAYKNVPLLKELRFALGKYLKEGETLAGEGNYYYDVDKCGIGFHGDAERKKVVAIRLCNGKCYPIEYQWFLKSDPIGKRAIIQLEDRDLYVMSEKASGFDFKKKNIPTLRHAVGPARFTKIG